MEKSERLKRLEAFAYAVEVDYEAIVNGIRQSIPLSEEYFSQRLRDLREALKETEGDS